jgi:hypothetical protein
MFLYAHGFWMVALDIATLETVHRGVLSSYVDYRR